MGRIDRAVNLLGLEGSASVEVHAWVRAPRSVHTRSAGKIAFHDDCTTPVLQASPDAVLQSAVGGSPAATHWMPRARATWR